MNKLLVCLLFFSIFTSYSQVVINEVMHFPGPNTSTNQGLKRKEYIEIYNNSCSPVDIGCWILGNSMYGGLGNYIGSFQFPSGTIIGAKSHLVIGSTSSQNATPYPAAAIDFNLTTVGASFSCDPNSRWLMPNTVGMVGLYDQTGVVKDAIYWGSAASDITTDTDFDSGLNPCKPSGAGNTCPAISGNLKNAKEIYTATPSLINYVGTGTSADRTFSRIPDGGSWSRNITPSIVGSNCNGGTCAQSFTTPAVVTQPSCGANNGSIVINPNPTGTYTYTWTPNVSTTNTGSNLVAGSYTISVDANGCKKDTTITLASGVGPTAIATTPTNPSCGASNGQVVLGAVTGGVAPYQYNFNGLGYSATTTYTGLAAGSYTLLVRDANGCIYTASNVVLTSGAGPTAIASTPTNPNCGASNGQVVLGAVTGGVAPYQYNFNSLGYSVTTTYTGLAAGSYSLLVRDANGCIYTASNVVLTPGAGPTAIASTPTDPSCGATDGQVVLGSVTGGVAPYTYNFNNLGYTASTSYTGLGAGTYTLVVRDAGGCTYTASNIVLSNGTGPTGVVVTPTNPSCGGSNGQVVIGAVTGGVAPYTYDFNGAGFNTTTTFTSLGAATYTLSVSDVNGCIYIASNIVLTNGNGPTAILSTSVNEKCSLANGQVTLGAVTGGLAPFQYNFNNLGYSATTSYTGLGAGSYSLLVRDANSCVFTANNIILTNSPGPTNVSSTKVDETCGASNGQVTIGTVTGGTSPYRYEFNKGGYTSALVYSNLAANSYTLSVIDANDCVYNASAINITNTAGPTDIDASVVDAKCEKANGSIQINSVIGGQPVYVYSLNNSSYSNSLQFSSLSPGQYVLKVKDGNSCIFQKTLTISNLASPIADFNYTPMVISSEAEDVTATNTSAGNIIKYTWVAPNGAPNSGAALNFTTNFNIQEEGSYPIKLIVENQNGCIDSITKFIVVKIEPTIYVPNTFTPDADAFNNSWMYYLNGYDVTKFTLTIFNRWGEIVWESKDPAVYWDGTFNGKLVQSGTYTWTLNVKDDNTDEVFYYRGHINVIY
jgi:gliding motility-associated-like protein